MPYEGISSYLHNKRQKALQKAVGVMDNNINVARNKIFYLAKLMNMYGIYNSETLGKIASTIQEIHNRTTWNEKLFSARLDRWYK